MARDPVCGETVGASNAAVIYSHKGRDYFFHSIVCLEKFKVEPEKYLGPPPVLAPGANKLSEPALGKPSQ